MSMGMGTGIKGVPGLGRLPRYLVKEHFYTDPPDWDKIIFHPVYNWFTHDAINKNIDVSLKNDFEFAIHNRYSKSHIAFTDEDNIEFEQEYEVTNDGSTTVLLGEFNKDITTNVKNMLGIYVMQHIPAYLAMIYDSDGNLYLQLPIQAISRNVKYKYVCKYNKWIRRLNVKCYEGDVLINEEMSHTLVIGKTFTVNCLGIGNIDGPGGGQSTGKYDSAVFRHGSQSISKSLIPTKKNIGTVKGGKVRGSISSE